MMPLAVKGPLVHATNEASEQPPLKRIKATSSLEELSLASHSPSSPSLITLPDELLEKVISYFATPEDCRLLGPLSQVSSRIRPITDSPKLWESIAEALPVKSAPLNAPELISWKDKIRGHFYLVKAHEARAEREIKAIKRWVNKAKEAVKAPSPYYACLPDRLGAWTFFQIAGVLKELVREKDLWALEEHSQRLQYKRDSKVKLNFQNKYGSLLRAFQQARSLQQRVRLKQPYEEYDINSPAARSYVEKYVAQVDRDAIHYKIQGLLSGSNGYPHAPQQATAFIEELIVQGNQIGHFYKIEGYLDGCYGYPEKPKNVRALLEIFAAQGNWEALQLQVNALIYGWEWIERETETKKSIYSPAPQEAIKLIRTYSLPLHVFSLPLS